MLKTITFTALSLFYSGLALAADKPIINYGDMFGAQTLATAEQPGLLQLSAAKTPAGGEFTKMPAGIKDKPVFEEDWLTANKIHKYLGIGSITLAILTALVPKPTPDNTGKGSHKKLAEGAAVLGGAAVATGVMFHHDDIFNYGMSDPDNLHATYATLGAIGFAMAVSAAPADEHVGYGILGAVLMAVGIKYTW